MRWLVLSDIHANFEALAGVIADARRQAFDRTVLLGDLVGYGASPNEVVETIRELPEVTIVRGNHDKVASGISPGDHFNDVARVAADWTRDTLTPANLAWLRDLPEGPRDAGGFLIAHGSPLDEEDYLLGELDAGLAFGGRSFPIAFFGHTHFACLFEQSEGRARLHFPGRDNRPWSLEKGRRYLINPGSIGQPRDHDPRAAYALFDAAAGSVAIRRVEYDVAGAAARIIDAGLPPVLAQRLPLGV